MDLEEKWQKALEETEIPRFFKGKLKNYESTTLPYIFLGDSLVNIGDTVVRKGKIVVDQPMIFLPQNIPQFTGFDFQEELGADEDSLQTFLLIRGISFPSLKYNNEMSTLDVLEQSLEKAKSDFLNELERKEDITTGVIIGSTDFWQLSLLIYIITLINRSISSDVKKFLEDLKKRFKDRQ